MPTQVVVVEDEPAIRRGVADALRLTPTAVKVRLHRARQALSTLLRKTYAPSPVTS